MGPLDFSHTPIPEKNYYFLKPRYKTVVKSQPLQGSRQDKISVFQQDMTLRAEHDSVGVLSPDRDSAEINTPVLYPNPFFCADGGKFRPVSRVEALGFRT